MTESRTDSMWVYVGTYTRREPHVEGKSEGIQILRFDRSSGQLTRESTVTGLVNPSFLALHPQGNALYAVSEIADFGGRSAGAVHAFSLDPASGQLAALNQRSTKGAGPAFVTVDKFGKNVLIANYGGGSVTVLPIQPDLSLGSASDFIQHEGSGVNPQRQEGPHAHSIVLDDVNRHALAADLGLDKIMIYRYDAGKGSLTPNPDQTWARTKSGAGPRHIDFHPSLPYVYVINELDSTATAYHYDVEKGAMAELQSVSTLPDGFDGRNHPADIHVHPSGKYVYGSNRGHDSIAIFAVNEETGELADAGFVPSGGSCPRGFTLGPEGKYALVANQNSDNIVVFSVDGETGTLTPTGEPLEVPTPVCVKMLA